MPWRTHCLPLLVFALLTTAFLGDVLLLPNSLSAFDIILNQPAWRGDFGFTPVHNLILSDSPTAHYPQRQIMIDLLRQGQVMGLNPYSFAGSIVHTLDSGALLTGLPMLFLPLADALDWSTWLRMILAAFFMYLLLMDMRLARGAATAGGIVWAFCLHQIVWLEFPQHLATQLWMPLILMLNLRLVRAGWNWRSAFFLWLVNILFLTSGYLQIALYFYVLIALFNTIYLLLDFSRSTITRIKCWIVAHAVFLAAAICLAPLLFLSTSLIEAGVRGLQDSRTGLNGVDVTPALLWQSLLALVPSVDEIKRFYAAPYLGGLWMGFGGQKYDSSIFGNLVEGGTYFGILPLYFLLLAIAGIFSKRCRSLSAFGSPGPALLLALVLPLLFFWCLLQQNPLVLLVVNQIPLFGLGSYGRAITIISLLAAILAAVGFQFLQNCLTHRRFMLPGVIMANFIALPFLVNVFEPSLQLRSFAYPLVILLLATAAVVVITVTSKFSAYLKYSHAVIFIIAADLFIVGYDFNTRMDNEKIFPATKTIETLIRDPEPLRVAVITDESVYQPNLLMFYKIPVIGGYSTVADKEYVWFMRHFYRDAYASPNGILKLGAGNIRVLRSIGAKYVITNRDVDKSELEPVSQNDVYALYKIKNYLPRVYCASHSYAWSAESDRQGRFGRALAENDRPVFFTQPPGLDGALTENCKVSEIKPYTSGVSYQVETDKDTLVFMPYKFYESGWQLTLNGESVEPLRANYAFMAIKIPPGAHSVSLTYSNRLTFILAIVLIIVGVITLVIVFICAFIFLRAGKLKESSGVAIALPLTLAAIVLIVHGALALPGIRNDNIPERPSCPPHLPDTTAFQNCVG